MPFTFNEEPTKQCVISDTENQPNECVPFDHWPCKRCGAEGPTINGHDPCIEFLPGVMYACCGHGIGKGYVMFESGQVIRGWFDTEKQSGLVIRTWNRLK